MMVLFISHPIAAWDSAGWIYIRLHSRMEYGDMLSIPALRSTLPMMTSDISMIRGIIQATLYQTVPVAKAAMTSTTFR